MKLLLVISLFLIASGFSMQKDNSTTISGKVSRNNLKKIELTLYGRPPQTISDVYTIDINDNSEFSIDIPIERLRFGKLKIGKKYYDFCLMPKDKISLDINRKSIVYSGKGAGKNNFLLLAHSKNLSGEDYYKSINSLKFLPLEFPEKVRKFRDNRNEFLDAFSKKNNLDEEFVDFYKINNQVNYEFQVIYYPEHYANSKKVDINSIKLPKEYVELSNISAVMNDEKIVSREYIQLLQILVYKDIENICKDNPQIDRKQVRYKLLSDSLSGKTQAYYLANQIKANVSRNVTDSTIINNFYTLNADKFSSDYVESAVGKYSTLQDLKGQPLNSDFSNTLMYDTKDNELKFGEMLEKYKGKVVYLDIWTPWCGPCRREMPNSKILKEKLKNEPIEIVYISADGGKINDWEKRYKITFSVKNHYAFQKGLQAGMLKFIGTSGIPVYMIFDKRGRLVEYQAEWPSNPNIEKKLKELAEDSNAL